MKKYIAFLRGINISGKNKISMEELKKNFEEFGFKDVKTYLNSGNVIFLSDEKDINELTIKLEKMIKRCFGFDIPIFCISQEELTDILQNTPAWWGNENKEIYNNLIFIMQPATFSDVFNEIGEPKKNLENIKSYKNVIFWSFIKKDYRKTNWWSKTASSDISRKLTIRTANTVKKVSKM